MKTSTTLVIMTITVLLLTLPTGDVVLKPGDCLPFRAGQFVQE
jgi:ABC-type cobalamin transport system permease subunit